MPALNLDRKTFWVIIAVLTVIIAVCATLLVLQFTGALAPIFGIFAGGEQNTNPVSGEESGPWGYKTYKWSYDDKQHTFGMEITNSTFKQFNVNNGDNPLDYIITSNDGGAVRTVGDRIKSIAKTNNYDSQETLELALAFVGSLSYKADYETGHSYDYPRAPVVTLAEMTGDSEDFAILAAAVLEYLGYGAALAYYPPMQSTVNLYPEATALAIIGSESDDGPVYCVETNYPRSDVRFVAGGFFGAGLKGTSDAKAPGQSAEFGWFAGEGYRDGVCIGRCAYIPSTGEFESENMFGLRLEDAATSSYIIKDAAWVLPVKIVWLVDTNSKSVPREVYDVQTPVILSDDALWKGKAAESDSSGGLPGMESLLDIPVPGYYDNSGRVESEKKAHEFFNQDAWYKSDISWSMSDKWRIHEKFLTIKNITATALYTPWNTADCTAQSYWRLAYSAKGSGKGVKGMTPYSSAQIVVYRIVDGVPVLQDITGWQGTSGADEYGKSRIYEPGEYAIGVFVRNADIKVDVEYFGTPTVTKYKGGI